MRPDRGRCSGRRSSGARFTAREDSHASRTVSLVDEQGWRELTRIKQEALDGMLRGSGGERRTAGRERRGGHPGAVGDALLRAAAGGELAELGCTRLPVRAAFWRFSLSSSTLRRRTDSGVTSTHSSSRRNSTAASSERRVGRRQALEHVGAGGAHVGLLLLLGRVDVHVLGAGVLADDHPLVDLLAGADEERAAVLEARSARSRRSCRGGRRRASRSGAVRSSPAQGSQRSKTWCMIAGAAGLGEELGAEADQAAGRDQVLHPHPAGRRG